jgi:ribosomal 50S subunit-associated protein YjgA (DUF615 family)
MDLRQKEDIQFQALSVFSESLVKARANIQVINEKIRNPTTETNTKATLHATLRNSMQLYDSLRINQAKKKQEVLKGLFAKYPSLDHDEIQRCLDMAVNEYELIEKNSNV